MEGLQSDNFSSSSVMYLVHHLPQFNSPTSNLPIQLVKAFAIILMDWLSPFLLDLSCGGSNVIVVPLMTRWSLFI